MEVTSLRSRLCRCGIKLLLNITKMDFRITGISLTEDPESRTVSFIEGKRSSRTIRTSDMGLCFLYCRSCKAKVQVRTFDIYEGEPA